MSIVLLYAAYRHIAYAPQKSHVPCTVCSHAAVTPSFMCVACANFAPTRNGFS